MFKQKESEEARALLSKLKPNIYKMKMRIYLKIVKLFVNIVRKLAAKAKSLKMRKVTPLLKIQAV
jgi:hypothetical protein